MPPRTSQIRCAVVVLATVMSHPARGGVVGGTFTNVGNDTQDRFFHRASLLPNGYVMVTGGMRLQAFPPSLISHNAISFFNPAMNSFSASFQPLGGGSPVTPVLSTARSSHTQTSLLDGRVLITGGNIGASGTSPGTPTASVEIFNPQTGAVTAGPTMASARADHRAVLLPDGRVVVAGGNAWQVFNPTGNVWSADFPMQRSRFAHAAVLLANHAGAGQHRVLLIGGTGTGPDTLELLNPDGGTSVLSAATLNEGVDDLGAELLDNGRVFIVGGQSTITGNTLNTTQLYDPLADSIAAGPPMPNRPDGIADHQVIGLGRFVLVFGGEQQASGTDTELNYAALFDRATDAWYWNGVMNNVHDDFASARLNDGRILLIGGGVPLFGQEAPSRAAETFTPTVARLGDVNDDGFVDMSDVAPFVQVALDPASATTQQYCSADANVDGWVDGRDVGLMVRLVLGN